MLNKNKNKSKVSFDFGFSFLQTFYFENPLLFVI